ncbi:hypothetical protein [uncultured Aliiroseovarius sp.]|uniref:hypothetical protein n=1 Tax=uncultured Aliiroseovarius sp. TaxID=1658783 RepID=UPI002599C045|nr:hypothetical protein [uncultured Aliiroseovarius sp.]
MEKMSKLSSRSAVAKPARPVILAVGEVSAWRQRGFDLPMDSQITFAEFHEVGGELLDAIAPDVVLSPLLSSAFDCLDLAQLLKTLGFKGRYRAMSGNVPNPAVILSEISACCPGLDFDLLKIEASSPQLMN